ncbi:MAG: DNA polymerase III subunit [Elusimicrobiota bacterium]|nr:DNA polymerase III subunit [Elusimicrobiota bacterium]
MSFSDIVGQDKVINLLKKQLWLKRIPHAYLFVGPEGVGKKKTALELAKILNCERPTNSKQVQEVGNGGSASDSSLTECCDSCISCKKITKGLHPDVHLIDFNYQAALLDEEPARQTQIKIDTIRELQKQISLKPQEGFWKVFIIDNAEKLSQEASNCLLKTLEEPPENSLLVLISTVKFALPQTIISRCQYVRFCELKDEDIFKVFNCSPELMQTISKFSCGSVGKAREILEQDLKEISELTGLFNRLIADSSPSIDYYSLLEFSERISKDRNRVEKLLLQIIVLLREKLTKEPAVSEIIQFVVSLRQSMRYNINLKLLTDVLLLSLSKSLKFNYSQTKYADNS